MERTETIVIDVLPERKQAAIRKQQEFGWTLVSAQEGTELTGSQSRKQVKLLFTRTASSEWLEDMKHLENELQVHEKSARFGSDGLVLIGGKPMVNLPIPILIVIAFAGYLVGWVTLEIVGGIAFGIILTVLSWFAYRQQAKRKLQRHTETRRKATDAFKKKRHEILVRVRAHENTRASSL